MPADPTVSSFKAVARLYNALMTGLVLTLVSQRDRDAARRFVLHHFRRQHLEKFLPGLKKLGLDRLPHAVACAQYHYFSNALGGVKTEYTYESDRKAWVRYPPPRWIWSGTAICGIPREVNEAMLHGWHAHNGVSLDNPRLGFVVTGQTVEGDPGLEGYYYEYDHDLKPDERLRFAPDEKAPPFDPDKQPTLSHTDWPDARLKKVERSYAMEYVRSLLPTMLDLFGPAETRLLVGRAAKLIGLQFYDEIADLLEIPSGGAAALADLIAALSAGQGESVTVSEEDGVPTVRTEGWRLMSGIDLADETAAFEAWSRLYEGLAAAHDRNLQLNGRRDAGGIVWRITPMP